MKEHFFIYSYDEFEDYGFRIYGHPPFDPPVIFGRYGSSPQGRLYMEVSSYDDRILKIDCELKGILQESDFDLLDIRSESDLEPLENTQLWSNWGYGAPSTFILNLNPQKRELELIFEPCCYPCYPCYYHVDGRVEYYYGENGLIYIKVIDLTEQEYKFLKSFG